MKKEGVVAGIWSVVLLVTHVPFLMASPSTVPAFLWSPHYHPIPHNGINGAAVNYQTISSKDLPYSILSQKDSSNLLCSGNKLQQPLDLVLIFVGRELLSSDISANKNADPALFNFVRDSFTRSNFSMAFPYVAASDEETMENSLISGFAENCGQNFEMSNVAFSDSCSMEYENFQKLADVDAFLDYLVSRMKNRQNEKVDLAVFCQGSRSVKEIDQPMSERKVFSKLINSMDATGAKYAVLYVSDPMRSIQYPSHREVERFLIEGGARNGSSTVCNEVCQIKSSLLEGVLVGIVLLIILISGLCCMMGIDTPTRFETPQDS